MVYDTMGNAADPILKGTLLKDVLHQRLSIFLRGLRLLMLSDVLKDLRQASRVG